MQIFSYKSYKKFALDHITSRPKNGHGQLRALAQHLNVHTTLVSQIFKGERHLTLEQAANAIDFFSLTHLESQMFLSLVELERAGTPVLKKLIEDRIFEIQKKANVLNDRLPVQEKLSESSGLLFYSNWLYSAIRLLTDLEEVKTIHDLCLKLHLKTSQIQPMIEFLLNHGLIIKTEDGFQLGAQSTHVAQDSPLVLKHHQNWRLKGFNVSEMSYPDNLFFTAPVIFSKKDFQWLRSKLLEVIDEFYEKVKSSPSEELACFNIDLFKVL